MQQIVSQLVHRGDASVAPSAVSPWVEMRPVPRETVLGMLDGQTHRRFMKTHLPLDALPWDPRVKYIFVARDPRDLVWSAYDHMTSGTPAFFDLFRSGPPFDGPELAPPSGTARDMFLDLVRDDFRPENLWPFWSHMRSWWAARRQPNLLMVHFSDLKADMEGQVRRVAEFLDVPELAPGEWADVLEHCTFSWMKAHADMAAPPGSDFAFKNGPRDFVNKGTNARWASVLSDQDCRLYFERARRELGEECTAWLQHGGPVV